MSVNPFSTTAPAAPATPAAPAAPVAPITSATPGVASVTPNDVAPVTADTVKKDRKKPNRQMTAEERKYVIQNYATKNTSELAVELGLTRQQVYGTVRKSREVILARIATATAAGDTATATKLQTFVETNLPEKPFGGGAGTGTRGSSIDSAVDDLLAGL